MKKIIKISFILIIVVLCCACDGSITRAIRHDGFTVGKKFKCDDFIPKKKSDSYKKTKYFTGSRLIDSNGEIYELSLDQLYANNQNCKKANTKIKVDAIFDNKIVKGTDGKYYYLEEKNASYSEIPATDNSYVIYDILLKPKDVVKVITADSNKGLYYVLKTDGNVYGLTISKGSYGEKPSLMGTTMIYDKYEYDSEIVDFNYSGNSPTTYVMTEDSIYRMQADNQKECKKYADVTCNYELKEDKTLKKYKDRIIMFNGNTLITDYNLIFKVAE